MEELLVPSVKVVLREAEGEHRKTRYDLLAVYHDDLLVSVDTRIPNRLLFEAFKERRLDAFSQYSMIQPEYVYGRSRFDFLLHNNRERCLIEAKSCTLVRHRVALFPDAPTLRGRRHVSELAKARQEGYRACVIFIIQRTDVDVFSPNDATDPAFGAALRQASAEGVELYAYSSELTENEVLLRTRIRINLRGSETSVNRHYTTLK
jgi:sugar fermentation stimulation protein A